MEAVESRLEELRTIERDRQEGDSRVYAETVAAQARALPWRVTVKAFGQVLSRLGRTVEDLERDAATIRQSDSLAGQLRSAKVERDSAVAELETLDADLRETRQRLAAMEGRQQELRSASSNYVWMKAAHDQFRAKNAALIDQVDRLEGENNA